MARTRRLTREETQHLTRERLLEAARRLLARSGFHGASVEAIAAEAGYTKGAVYSNFASKEAIFLELLGRHMRAETEELGRLVDGEIAPDRVIANVDRWLETMNADADWALVAIELQLHARRSPAFALEYDALYAAHRNRLADLLETVFARAGRQLPAPARAMAAGFIALAHGLVLEGARKPGEGDPAGPLIKTILRSLLAAAPEVER
ncbi:MAG: helix-turn-helix domain-containing protein [Hyphomonadaceae bacterium]|nr:helix-turn-helix domain-containing protein [Hyphomonadaceae bacterium]